MQIISNCHFSAFHSQGEFCPHSYDHCLSCPVCSVLIHMMFVMIIKVMFVIMMDILGSLKKESSLIDLTSVDEDQGKLHSGIRCQIPGHDDIQFDLYIMVVNGWSVNM